MNVLVKSIIVMKDTTVIEHDKVVDRSRRASFRRTMAEIGSRLSPEEVRKIHTAIVIFNGCVYRYNRAEAQALLQVNRTVH